MPVELTSTARAASSAALHSFAAQSSIHASNRVEREAILTISELAFGRNQVIVSAFVPMYC